MFWAERSDRYLHDCLPLSELLVFTVSTICSFYVFFCVCLCIEQIAAWKDEDGDWYETGLHIFCKLRFLVLEVLFMIFVFFKIISVINIQVAYTC